MFSNMENLQELRQEAREVRRLIIDASYRAGKNCAHIGGSLSMVEILVSLYDKVKRNPDHLDDRDRVIISKAHASLALYAVLVKKGLISEEELMTFEQNGSHYTAHAKKNIAQGLEFSGGSLGLGFSYSVGIALALKEKKSSAKVFTILGDGECNEGIIWEGLLFAKHNQLDNLTVIVDHNHLQADGKIEDIVDTSSLKEKFTAFGFYTQEIDGHSVEELSRALKNRKENLPNAIIAETIKGKGVSFMENKANWHFSALSENRYKKAIEELGKEVSL